MKLYDVDNEMEVNSLQAKRERIIDEYNGFISFERAKESDMDYLYQKAIVDDDNLEAEMSPELSEIREEQKRLFLRMQDEREEFMYLFKQKINNKIDDIDTQIKDLTREKENE